MAAGAGAGKHRPARSLKGSAAMTGRGSHAGNAGPAATRGRRHESSTRPSG
jgi:hypothetical protein